MRLLVATAACLLALGSASVSAQQVPGLSGQVVVASRCPVPLGGDDTTCPSLPMATSVGVCSADGSTEVASVATDAAGQFSVSLDPGQYLLVVPASDGARIAAETPVTVAADAPTMITIQVRPGPRSLP